MRIERMPEQKTQPRTPPRMLPSSTRWVIVRDDGAWLEPLCVGGGGERMLPVFSFEEEAEMFLLLGDYDGCWRARESGAGEIVSLLYGPCAGVESVALDPLPEMLEDGTLRRVGVGRERFLGRLLAR